MRPTRPWFLAAGLVLAGAALLPARVADQPMRRSGLWEINVKAMGMANVIQSCVDASKDKPDAMIGSAPGRQICDTAQMTPAAEAAFQFHVVCHPSAKMTMVSDGTVTGDMQSAYTVNSTMTMDPAPARHADHDHHHYRPLSRRLPGRIWSAGQLQDQRQGRACARRADRSAVLESRRAHDKISLAALGLCVSMAGPAQVQAQPAPDAHATTGPERAAGLRKEAVTRRMGPSTQGIEPVQRALPRELCGGFVVARRGVVVETVVGAGIDVALVRHAGCGQRRIERGPPRVIRVSSSP